MLYTFACYFAKNVNRVKIDLCCADVCAFLTMLMRVKPVESCCNLGVAYYDCWINLKSQIQNIRQSTHFRLRNVNAICHLLSDFAAEQLVHALDFAAEQLVHALVTAWLDY